MLYKLIEIKWLHLPILIINNDKLTTNNELSWNNFQNMKTHIKKSWYIQVFFLLNFV